MGINYVKEPKEYTDDNYENYAKLMVKTNTLHRDNKLESRYPKSGKSYKWNKVLKTIWDNRRKYKGEGVVVIPSDPNTLLERLDLLLANKKAGHTNVGNKLVSLCNELKRQGVLDSRSYEKLISNIKI